MNQSEKLAGECRKRAQKKHGTGWRYLSHEQQQGAIALEVCGVVVSCASITEGLNVDPASIVKHLFTVTTTALYPPEEHPDTTAP